MTVTEETTHKRDNATMKKRKHCEVDGKEDGEVLHIVVRRVGKAESESLILEVGSDATVLDLKEKIAETLEEQDEAVIPIERQRLIFSGKMLRDESLSLETDLNMKAGDDHKHFVHLTPLPKGAAPSARTERELSENPISPQEATLQRARARQRRRRRHEPRRGLTDPAAYHPYALDLTSGSLLPTAASGTQASSSAAASLGLSASPAEEAALLSVAAAAEQSRLLQEAANRAALPDALQAVLLAQQQQNLLTAAGAGGSAAALLTAAAANPLCPLASQADAATSLLESLAGRAAPAPSSLTAASILRLAQPQLASPVAAAMPSDADRAAAALQEILSRPRPTENGYLPEILDQIAAGAGELATALRLLSPQATPAAASLPTSPPPVATVSAATTPQDASDLARRLLLEERLASLSSPGSFLPGFF